LGERRGARRGARTGEKEGWSTAICYWTLNTNPYGMSTDVFVEDLSSWKEKKIQLINVISRKDPFLLD
jgi:hypothetical protein